MLVEHFKSRDIVGHWYTIVFINFHEHAMIGMMVLRWGYALVFVFSDARKPFQGMECPRWGCQWKLEGEWLHRRGDRIPEGLCNREWKVKDGFVLVISIVRWNQMYIGIAPWNNELVTIHWEDKWSGIMALDIGCRFDFVVDSRLPEKEVNPSITLRMEVWASGFPCYEYRHCILLFVGWGNVHMCICGYWKYCNELCYKAPVCSMLSWGFDFEQVFHYKYCNELCYKAPWAVCFVFSSLVHYRCHWTLRMVFPQGGGFCNNPCENSM